MHVSAHTYPNPLAPWIIHSYMQLHLLSYTEKKQVIRQRGLVCMSAMTTSAGEVFCRQMKGMFLWKLTKGELPEGYSGVFYQGQIQCSGDELNLADCTTDLRSTQQCLDGYVMIECTPGITASVDARDLWYYW